MGPSPEDLPSGPSSTLKPHNLKLPVDISVNRIFTFVAIVALLASIHSLYLYQYRLRYEATPTLDSDPIDTKSQEDEESQIAPPATKFNVWVPSFIGKCVTGLAAGAYIAFTWHVIFATAAEHNGFGPISLDSYLRNALAGGACSLFCRLPVRNKNGLSKKYQADALLLIIIPYILNFYAPPTNFQERTIIDRVILPTLGALCFVGSML